MHDSPTAASSSSHEAATAAHDRRKESASSSSSKKRGLPMCLDDGSEQDEQQQSSSRMMIRSVSSSSSSSSSQSLVAQGVAGRMPVGADTSQNHNAVFGSTATSLASTSSSASPDYDEGVLYFGEPLSSSGCGCSSCCCSHHHHQVGILYNGGVQYLRQQDQMQPARKCFEHVVALASNCNYVQLHFQAMCNVAYTYFSGQDYASAVQTYQRALTLVLSQQDTSWTVAALYNSIGVMAFYASQQQQQQQQHDSTEPRMIPLALEALHQSLRLCHNDTNDALTATVYNNLGRVLYLQSKYASALQAYQQALEIRNVVYQHDHDQDDDSTIILHPDIGATVYNMAQAHHQLGQYELSIQYYQRFLHMLLRLYPHQDRQLALVYKCLGEVYQDAACTSHDDTLAHQARTAYQASWQAAMRAFGPCHAECASILNRLGNLSYQYFKDFHSAREYYQQGLAIERQILPAHHAHIGVTLMNLGHVYKHQKEYRQAVSMYRQALSIQKVAADDKNKKEIVATTLSSMGLMHYHLKEFDHAFECYQQALQMRRDTFQTEEHPEIASTLNSIGLVVFQQGHYEMARQCFAQSLILRLALLGRNHADVAILWYNLGTCTFELGDHDLAIQFYQETLRVERISKGETHVHVAVTLQHIGQVHQQLGRFEAALDHYRQAWAIRRLHATATADPTPAAKLLNLMGNVQLQLGDTAAMMESLSQAARLYHGHAEKLVITGYNYYGLAKTNPPCAHAA